MITQQTNFFNLSETPEGVTFTVPHHLRLQFVEALRRQIAWLESQEQLGMRGMVAERKLSDGYGLTALRLRQLASEWAKLENEYNTSNNS